MHSVLYHHQLMLLHVDCLISTACNCVRSVHSVLYQQELLFFFILTATDDIACTVFYIIINLMVLHVQCFTSTATNSVAARWFMSTATRGFFLIYRYTENNQRCCVYSALY